MTKLANGSGGLSVQSIDPNTSRNHGLADITIKGSGFVKNGTTAKLAMAGQVDIMPLVAASVVDGNTLAAGFDLTGKKPGKWDVVVTNPDASSAHLQQGFTVTPVSELALNVNGQGAVAIISPEGVGNCTSSGILGFDGEAVTLTLTATPANGYAFTGWSGAGCSGIGLCKVTLTGAQNVSAAFTVAVKKADLTVSSITTTTGSTAWDDQSPIAWGKVVPAGGNFIYNVTVKNNGTDTATNVILRQSLDKMDFVAADPGCSFAAGNPPLVTCDIGTLAKGKKATRHITARTKATDAGAIFENFVVVTGSEADPHSDNNDKSVRIAVVEAQRANLELQVTGPKKYVLLNPGEGFVYTVTVKNKGPDRATDVTLAQTLSNVSFRSVSDKKHHLVKGGNFGYTTLNDELVDQALCNVGSLEPGQSLKLYVNVTAQDPYPQSAIVNDTRVFATEPNADPGKAEIFTTHSVASKGEAAGATVDLAYHHLLERDPSGAERDNWIKKLVKKGQSVDDMWTNIAKSTERLDTKGFYAPARTNYKGKREQCFGAIGSGCDGVPDLPLNIRVVPAFRFVDRFTRPYDGMKMGYIEIAVEVGSILHDNICLRKPWGAYCDGLAWGFSHDVLADTVYAPFKSLDPAALEWNKAVYNVIDKRFWIGRFGPYPLDASLRREFSDDLTSVKNRTSYMSIVGGPFALNMNTVPYTSGETRQTLALKAPKGASVDLGDSEFCVSKSYTERNFLEGPLNKKWGKCN